MKLFNKIFDYRFASYNCVNPNPLQKVSDSTVYHFYKRFELLQNTPKVSFEK